MNLIENWVKIVEQNDEKAIIPYLKQLNDAQKQDLLPTISKTAKAYLEVKDRLINHKHFYTKKASNKQDRILNYSIFICIKELANPLHKWLDVNKIITSFVHENILHWYCPKWLSSYLNDFAKQEEIPVNIRYDLVMRMADKGYIEPSKPLLARLVTKIIYQELPNQKWVYEYEPKALLRHSDTLKKHTWYLFDYKTQIYSVDRYLKLANEETLPKNCWYDALKKMSDAGKIDRIKLLKACLTATLKTVFNKPAVGWFAVLFEYLAPTEKELIEIQSELFATFTLPYSKAINTTLKSIKKATAHPNFKVDDCLINFDKLLANKTKSVVTNALYVLQKLAVHHPDKHFKICDFTTVTFTHKTEELQIKAAKIINQYGVENKEKLVPKIANYQANLFVSTQKILKNFGCQHITEQTDNQLFKIKKEPLLSTKNKIKPLDTFDDFVKLALQVFNNQQSYHFDQFLAGLLKFQNEIRGAEIKKFTPLFKRAYQLVYNELPNHQGMIDNILGIFFMDWGDLLIGRYPEDSQGLKKIAKTYLEQGFFINEEDTPFDLNYANLYRWYNPYDPSEVYTPLKKLLGGVLQYLHQNKIFPLLSTPTHSPMWIDPIIFVEKLAIYQDQKEIPNAIDLQLAISRIAFENNKKALLLAKEKLKNQYYDLVDFLLNKNKSLPSYINEKKEIGKDVQELQLAENTHSFYYGFITAGITKHSISKKKNSLQLPDLQLNTNYFTGNHDWMIFWEERRFEDWNHKTHRLEFVGAPFIHRELQVKIPKGMKIENHPNFLYQYFPGNDEPFRPNINDVKRLLGLLPNNPEPLIALLIADNLKYANFWEENDRKRVIEIVNWLSNWLHQPYGEPIHLFLATSMLCGDKKNRIKVSELWKKGIALQLIDSELLGRILGKIEKKEFAPLKRFTDLAQNHLYKISPVHNHALEQLIANLAAKLPAIPIKNTKQLLVLYRELLALNKSIITNERLVISLALWQDSPSLKKVIRELKEYVEG